MTILVLLEPSAQLSTDPDSFHTERNGELKMKWHCAGPIEECFKGARIAGTIRATLEALQELHCEVDSVHIGATQCTVVPNGVVRAWTPESMRIAKLALEEIKQKLEELQQLRLRDFEFYIEYTLTQTIVDDTPPQHRFPFWGSDDVYRDRDGR